MKDYEDGVVLMSLNGLFEGHAVPTSNLQDAVFYPFDNVIPQHLLETCIVLACRRYTEQEVMNVSVNSTTELCVLYRSDTGDFYADPEYRTRVENIHKAHVFARKSFGKSILAPQHFIVPVRVRSVYRLELEYQQPNAINPHAQPHYFRVNEDGIFIHNSQISAAEIRLLTDKEIEETKRKQEEIERKAKFKTTIIPTQQGSDDKVSITGEVDGECIDTLTGQISAIPPFSDTTQNGTWVPASAEVEKKRGKRPIRSNLDKSRG